MRSISLSIVVLSMTALAAHAADRPNLMLLYTDDQRYDAMSCAGHPFLKTPNMDRLATEGAHCRNAFVTLPLCSPSRACIQSGQYSHVNGVIRNNGTDLAPDAVTFPKLLREAGCQTAYFGKWHQAATDEKRPGFDYWVSYKGQGAYVDPDINIDGERMKAKGYIDDLMTDYAIEWLTKGRDKSKPFSLCVGFKSVHGPFTPPDRCRDLYSDVPVTVPPTFNEPLDDKPAFISRWLANEKTRHMKFGRDVFIRNYNRTLRGTDDNLGRLFKALESMGQMDNTFIIFMSDNGYYQGEHGGLYDKRSAYEESIRVPMVIRYPKLIKPGTKVEKMVLNIDVAPTFLDVAGLPMPKSMQGRSMVPVLAGKDVEWRKSFLIEYFREQGSPSTPTLRAVRTDRYKYVTYIEPPDRSELYDLKEDPRETKNLHQDPAHAQTLAELKKELDRLMTETRFPADLRNEMVLPPPPPRAREGPPPDRKPR